jgi:hypothetical protein
MQTSYIGSPNTTPTPFSNGIRRDASCLSLNSFKDRKLTNAKSRPTQPRIPTFVEIVKTKFNHGRRKSESDKQDILCMSDCKYLKDVETTKKDFSKNKSLPHENIKRVGMRQKNKKKHVCHCTKDLFLQRNQL